MRELKARREVVTTEILRLMNRWLLKRPDADEAEAKWHKLEQERQQIEIELDVVRDSVTGRMLEIPPYLLAHQLEQMRLKNEAKEKEDAAKEEGTSKQEGTAKEGDAAKEEDATKDKDATKEEDKPEDLDCSAKE